MTGFFAFTSASPILAAGRLAPVLGVVALALPDPAMAEPKVGPYFAGRLAVGRLADQDINHVDAPFGRQPGGYIAADTGHGFSGAVGYSFANSMRAEIELSYRTSGFHRATAGSLQDADSSGDERYTAAFLNVYYDIRGQGAFTPFVGAGLGIARIDWDNVQTWNDNQRVRNTGADNSKAAQVMVGFSYDLPNQPNTSITAEIRHTRLLDKLAIDGNVVESRIGPFPIELEVENNRRTELLIGMRHSF